MYSYHILFIYLPCQIAHTIITRNQKLIKYTLCSVNKNKLEITLSKHYIMYMKKFKITDSKITTT